VKKFWIVAIVLFIIYSAGMSFYLLKGNIFTESPQYAGTAVDPHTFMTTEQIAKGESLTRIHSLAFFIETPLQMGLLIMLMGFSVRLRKRVESLSRFFNLGLSVYTFCFLLLLSLIFLPLDYILFRIDLHYGISNEPLAMWLMDHLKSFALEWISAGVVLWFFYKILRWSPRRWWLWFFAASIPVTLFLGFIQPVVLDPLYNHFQPLPASALKSEILALAAKSHIPAKQVYEVNMSQRTGAINAYVNGIGGNARIVLWDTTLQKLSTPEILTIMAHEIGHYVEKHIYWGMALALLLGLIVTKLAFYVLPFAIDRWGAPWKLRGLHDLAAVPLILLYVMLANMILTPVENAASRIMEHRADMYAMKMTGDGSSAIRAFQKIAAYNLSPVTEPKLLIFFNGTHPTIAQRILYFEHFTKNKTAE